MTSRHPTLPPILPAGGQSGISPARSSAFSVKVASRFGGRSRLNGPRYKLLWQTVAIAASMLIFASLRPSTTDVTAGDTTRSTMLISVPKSWAGRYQGNDPNKWECRRRQKRSCVDQIISWLKISRIISISTRKVLRPCRNLNSRVLGRAASVRNVWLLIRTP